MNKLVSLAASLTVATGMMVAATAPATAEPSTGGGTTIVWNPTNHWCQLRLSSGTRADAQVRELKRIYLQHFTEANKKMRAAVAADMGINDPSRIAKRQYTDADAAKIGLTKAQLQTLHDRLNRKGALEFVIPTGGSYFGYADSQNTTAKQVAALKKDRTQLRGAGVYWVTNDAGLVQYVPPAAVKAYYAKRLAKIYSPVLADKQRGAELSNFATQQCIKSRHNGNKEMFVPIDLLNDIHKFNPGWVNPPASTDTPYKPVTIIPIDEQPVYIPSLEELKKMQVSLDGGDYRAQGAVTVDDDGLVTYDTAGHGDSHGDGGNNSGSSNFFGLFGSS